MGGFLCDRFDLLGESERMRLASIIPGAAFRPSARQAAFLASQHPRRLLRAGNQVGKTATGAQEAWGRALGCHPWKKVPPGPNVGLVVSADWQSYVDVISRAMFATAPHAMISPSSSYSPSRGWKNRTIELENGSQILFRSANQGTTAIAGLTVDWLWIDEPPPPDIWGEAMTRVAVKQGPAWMTLTPIGRPVEWLREHIEGDPNEGLAPREDWEQHRIKLNLEDCPHRTPESIAAQISGYSTWELPQRRDGDWEGLDVDRKIDAFGPDNVGEPVGGKAYKVGLTMDHGENAGKECALVGCWSRELRRLFIVEEYQSPGVTTIDEDADGVRAALARRGWGVVNLDKAVGDINTAGKAKPGARINELFETALGVAFDTPDKAAGSVEFGVRVLNYALKSGMLVVSPQCAALSKCLRYWTGKNDDLKDFIDALRYLAVPILVSFLDKEAVDRLRMY